uniref:Uncharacterized protein n=1 Tax=Panagrolaimus sp. ES5 TaxID=591445 RepID=A0AC34F7N5_9BILA
MTEPFSPTISLPPDFRDEIESSVISVVTDPGNFGVGRTIEEEYFPSTSRSIDGRRQTQNERTGGGESDVRNPRVTRLRRFVEMFFLFLGYAKGGKKT